ncbi:cellulose synthase operon protein YhjQ/BcsQ [Moritella sp.]|uniref:AAA family ATPase n=1 Tax=Moritella sp. TaxID=78556 RepID=UPI0025E89328|nr:cellulose synthase operon protein YhjQ/BcsQ [Moritella sp.]
MVMQIQSLQPSPAQPKVVATGNVPACCYLTNDEQLAQNIEHVFFQAGVEQALRVHIGAVNDPVDALVAHSAEFGAPRILVLDIMVGIAAADEQAILGIQVVQQLTQSPLFADTLIIAIGTLDSATHYRQLRNAGVHDYLVAPVELDTLSITVMNALSSADLSSQSTPAVSNDAYIEILPEIGKRIAIVSAKGGAGCTTILSNLAWVLSQQKQSKASSTVQVACADLDFVTGDLDLHFNITANNRLIEMLEFSERLEPLVFERSAVKVQDNLSVLMGYHTQLEQEFWPDLAALETTSQFCQQQVDYLLWDVPSYSLRDSVGFGVLQNADVRIVVMAPTLSSIRHTKQLLTRLEDLPHQRTVLILNHTKPEKVSLISSVDVMQALGRQPDIILPYCPDKMLAANTLGRPVVAENKRLKKLFVQLAEKVQGDKSVPISRLSKWLRRG